jgi:flagellar biosynthesis protein FliR
VPAEVINSASLLSTLSWFLSGLLSVSICQVVKQRMKTGQFASAPDAVHLIVTKEGFKGLYAGATLQILRF